MLENKNSLKTPLSQMGKFGLKDYLSKSFDNKHESTILGVDEDASVVDFKNNQTVVTTELLIESVHFDLGYFPLQHLGYKSVIATINKIIALNATPRQIAINIAVSNRFSLEAIEEVYAGVKSACTNYQLDLVKSETTSSNKGLIISVTAIGEIENSLIKTKKLAENKDLLILSGDIGSAYMGLQVLEREKQVYLVNSNHQPDLDHYTYIIERQLKPEARIDVPILLKKLKVNPKAMLSVENGLVADVLQLCKQSNVGCKLYEDKLPLDPQFISVCEEFDIDSTTIALNGGEDYEILFTISMDEYSKIKANPNFTVVGHIVPETEGNHLITRENTQLELKARGFSK